MPDFIHSIGQWLTQHEIISSLPAGFLIVLALVLLIGWFCCTDYYDNYKKYINSVCDDYELLHSLIIGILIMDVVSIYIGGLTYLPHLVMNVGLLIVFIVPIIYNMLCNTHMYFKTKRGK